MAIDAARVRAGLLAVDEKGAQLSVRLTPDDRLYGPGCFVRFSAQSKRFPYYTALNLSASGAIQFLFPLKKFNDPIKWINPKAWSIKSKTGKPFGADFLIFIASESPLSALHTLLASRGPTLEPAVFYQALASELGGMRFEIGFKGVYTSPKGEACED